MPGGSPIASRPHPPRRSPCLSHGLVPKHSSLIVLRPEDCGRGRMHTKPPSKRLAPLLANSNGHKPTCFQILLNTKSPRSLFKPQTQTMCPPALCRVAPEDRWAMLNAALPTRPIGRDRISVYHPGLSPGSPQLPKSVQGRCPGQTSLGAASPNLVGAKCF